jgi:hypothetical protein
MYSTDVVRGSAEGGGEWHATSHTRVKKMVGGGKQDQTKKKTKTRPTHKLGRRHNPTRSTSNPNTHTAQNIVEVAAPGQDGAENGGGGGKDRQQGTSPRGERPHWQPNPTTHMHTWVKPRQATVPTSGSGPRYPTHAHHKSQGLHLIDEGSGAERRRHVHISHGTCCQRP